ncbi:hypothetical protein M514_11189 [Trichuris suis]|uniref:Homeobox domain-containing protein n=1 Tax=Trichuris suis TaxID=68888 RepID=A0A085N3W6_9BILA|nr:hypothetical protein M513_11189 [Trichuris suis]KFD64162.1 hypothetical protein M514_11189 [Trichuris suis]
MDAKRGSVVDQAENSDLVLSTTELASSLPLQMAIYFNAYFAPCWLIAHIYTLVQKYELLDVTHRSIVLALHLLMVVVEMVRLYVGFLGNITENVVSQLSGFWIATLLLQLPMCLFFTFSGGLISLPLDIGIDVVQVAFLLFELVVGVFAIRKMSSIQYSRFRKDITDTAGSKDKGKLNEQGMITDISNSFCEASTWPAAPSASYVEGNNANSILSLQLSASIVYFLPLPRSIFPFSASFCRPAAFNDALNGPSGCFNNNTQHFGEYEFAPLLQGNQHFVSVCYGLPGLPAVGTYVDMGIPGFERDDNELQKSGKTAGRSRVKLSSYQTSQLLGIFRKSPYISIEARKEVAKSLHLTEKQVRLWFQNRRRLNRWNRRKESNMPNAEQRGVNERTALAVTSHPSKVDSCDKHSFDDCRPFSIDYDRESDEDLLSVIVSKIF